jgi:phage shock protein A
MNHTVQTGMNAKQLERAAQKAKQSYLQFEAKAKAAMRAGNVALARTHGESAMRCKNEALTYLRLQAQVEGAQSKVQSLQVRQQAVGQIAEVNSMLEQAMPAGMMEETAGTLEKYGETVDNLDVQTRMMDGAFDEAGASSAPASDVDDLLRAIGADHAIDTSAMLPAVPQHGTGAHVHARGQAAPQYGAPARALPK